MDELTAFPGVVYFKDTATTPLPYLALGPVDTATATQRATATALTGILLDAGMIRPTTSLFHAVAAQPPGWRALLGPTEGEILLPDGDSFLPQVDTVAAPGWKAAIRGAYDHLLVLYTSAGELGDDADEAFARLMRHATDGVLVGCLVPCWWRPRNP